MKSESLAPARRFRLMAVRIALVLTVLVAAVAFAFDRVVGQGVLLGGIGGCLGFWIMAVRLEKVVFRVQEKVKFFALTWTFYRFALYAAVFYKAYTLDKESMHGLLGALLGILIIHFVLVFLGLTGADLSKRDNPEREEDHDS